MPKVSMLPVDHAPTRPSTAVSIPAFVSAVARQLKHDEAILTPGGRAAMSALFQHLQLCRRDEIYITTTFDYPNVSSCVTCTVFNFCKPSRVLSENTRAIFVIHEFGVPHPHTAELRIEASRRRIPLIEDCAHTLSSFIPDGWHVGALADWVIVSFPKIFPTLAGGMLIGRPIPYTAPLSQVKAMHEAAKTAATWWPCYEPQMERRRAVFAQLSERCRAVGFAPLFEVGPGITPWFFPVPTNRYDRVIEIARARGVDCGLWHGSEIVVFPCHQFLTDADLDQVAEALREASQR